MAEDLFNTLVSILRERDVPYDRDTLRSACNDPGSQTAIQIWTKEYLSPETLLTKDEAALYASLLKSGEAETLGAQNLSAVEGLNDQEIQDAIEELKRSTAAIEKQSEALRLQQNAMSALVKNDKRTSQARSHADQGQVRKWDVEKGQINKAIEELSQSLAYQITDTEQLSKASETSVKQTINNIFKSDDKLLLSLQKLASDLDPRRPESDDIIKRIRQLCARMIKHTVEGVRTRLDRIYLDALRNASNGADCHNSDEQEVTDPQEELESLYSEILPVAQMSAEQQFLEPAIRTIAASDGQGQERSMKAVKYIHDCLLFLVNRIETFLERTEESRYHNMATQFILDSAKMELSEALLPSNKTPASPIRLNTPRRRSTISQSPVKARNARRRSSGEDLEPEQQLARNLGIFLPLEEDSEQSCIEALEQVLFDRMIKLGIHANSLQSTTESSISSYFSDAHITLQLLQDCLLAESHHGKVRLLDPEIEASVEGFGQDVQYVQNSMEEIDLQQLQAKNMHRDQLVERWSR